MLDLNMRFLIKCNQSQRAIYIWNNCRPSKQFFHFNLLNPAADNIGGLYYKGFDMNHDIDILARTIYGEARGEIDDGKRAIGLVVLNRYRSKKWYSGNTIAEVCQKPWQFSCWNKKDPNCAKITTANESVLKPYWDLAERLVNGEYADITNGATHYHAKNCHPAWAKGKLPCAIIGNHLFFNNID